MKFDYTLKQLRKFEKILRDRYTLKRLRKGESVKIKGRRFLLWQHVHVDLIKAELAAALATVKELETQRGMNNLSYAGLSNSYLNKWTECEQLRTECEQKSWAECEQLRTNWRAECDGLREAQWRLERENSELKKQNADLVTPKTSE